MAVYKSEGCKWNCYPDTTVLINKLDIRNQAVLERIGRLKFERLKFQNYLRNMSDGELIVELTELYHELNMLHPFRAGNGRTLRLFITLLVRNADRDINLALCDTDMLTIATIKAVQGDLTMLRDVFEDIIE